MFGDESRRDVGHVVALFDVVRVDHPVFDGDFSLQRKLDLFFAGVERRDGAVLHLLGDRSSPRSDGLEVDQGGLELVPSYLFRLLAEELTVLSPDITEW